MSESRRYKLLFKGPKDRSPETIKQLNSAFITRFGLTIQEADAVFKSAPVAMKRAAKSEELTLYKEALEQAGATVEIVEDPGAVSGAIPVPVQGLSLSDSDSAEESAEVTPPREPVKKSEPLDLGLSLDDDEEKTPEKVEEKTAPTTKPSSSTQQSSELSLSMSEEGGAEEEMDLSIPSEPVHAPAPPSMSLSMDGEEEHTVPNPQKTDASKATEGAPPSVVEAPKNEPTAAAAESKQQTNTAAAPESESAHTPAQSSYKRRLEAKRAQKSFIISLLVGLGALGVFNFIYFGLIDVAPDSDKVLDEEIGREEPTPPLAPLIKAAAQHRWVSDKNCKPAELCGEIVIEEHSIIKLSLTISGTTSKPLTREQLAAGERLLALTKIELEGDVNVPIVDRKIDTILTGKVFFDDGDLKKRFPTAARLSGELLADNSLTLKVTMPESHSVTAAIPITEAKRENNLITFTVISLGAFKDTGPLATRSNDLIDEIRQIARNTDVESASKDKATGKAAPGESAIKKDKKLDDEDE